VLIQHIIMGITAGIMAQSLVDLLSEAEVNIIYSYWLSLGALIAIMAKNLLASPVPLVSRVHGFDLYAERNNPPLCPYQPFMMSATDKIITISDDGYQYLSNKYPSATSKLMVSRLGVSMWKRSEPSNDGILRLVSCSFLTPVKRVHLIAEALSLMTIPVEWVHIGDGPERYSIESVINEYTNNNIKVRLLGEMGNNKVLDYYENNRIDLFINVSSSEGIPVSIMEAMSRGIPVIAPQVGGIPEIINSHDGDGFLMPSDITPEVIVHYLKKYLKLDYSQRLAMRDAAYTVWHENYNADQNYSQFASDLLSMCSPL
jgi:glycosyltransferase involved in cell wall biosynthesis